MSQTDSALHVRGQSRYVDDLPHPEGMLYAAVAASTIAHARITELDVGEAEAHKGVRAVLTCGQIPGENQIGNIIPDEVLLADGEVHYIGQPVALVVAATARAARAAAAKVHIAYEELTPVFDPREAAARGHLVAPERMMSLGKVEGAWVKCDYIVDGTVESGGQEHIYLETQGALAVPRERGVKVYSSTQSPTAVQRITSRVLGLAMHEVEVEVLRLGGGFGGKEDQATPWAALAALAARRLGKPVKLVLDRHDDMVMTGKRHPYSSDFRIGLEKNGTIVAYEVTLFQNAGAAADLSTAILERSMLHATNSYRIPNVKIHALSCRTNLPPNTAFRGFGAPQAMFVMESAIHKAAQKMGVAASTIQRKNLLKDGDAFPYGMKVRTCRARACWDDAVERYDVETMQREIDEFNGAHPWTKKGVAIMPVCFGISFTSTFLNQAAALVHVYTDGSVGISTAAVEMGQGVNEKLVGIASRVFDIDPARVKIESTNTTRVANTSPTAASSDADMNGHATRLACEMIRERMKRVEGEHTWDELVAALYQDRVSLTAQAHYATPKIGYDRGKEKGEPFAYHVFGTAIVETTVDCLRGVYTIDAVRIVHDCGVSLNPLIDRGQVEGGLVQGLGWMTIENLVHDRNGRLLTDALATYKVPDVYFTPAEVAVHFLEGSENKPGPFGSKAVGEPPFMYGIGAYFAIMNAMTAFDPSLQPRYDAPMTHEKVFMTLYGEDGK